MKGRYLIIGGGHQGLAMAAHLGLSGEEVNLWNRTAENITELLRSKEVVCKGVIEGRAILNQVSTNIKDVYEDVILVTVPANAYKDIARMLAPYVNSDTIILLNPGRTFGALEFFKSLKEAGCEYRPKVAETQTILYTCRRNAENGCHIYAFKEDVEFSALYKEDVEDILSALPSCMKKYFRKTDSCLDTSLGNVGMILHCAPVLMNIGWIENQNVSFKYYYEGITETVAAFIEMIDAERVDIAKCLGINAESTAEWMKRIYGTKGNNLYECIRNNEYYREIDAPLTIEHRYLREDVPCGLVPMEALGKLTGRETPYISLIIDLACKVLKTDFRAIGRTISKEDLELILKGE